MEKITSIIDHTLLKPQAKEADIIKLCEEAKKYKFASVCINPKFVKLAAKELKGTAVKVCTVVGFPLGSGTTEAKAFETKTAVADGATEIDMVINIGGLIDNKKDEVFEDMKAVVEAAQGKCVKVILETCLLSKIEILDACEMAVKAGVDFVKTSTGFSTGGATVEAVKIMANTVGKKAGVKASGGIRSAEDAQKMIDAGATRLGCSAGVAIAEGNKSDSSY